MKNILLLSFMFCAFAFSSFAQTSMEYGGEYVYSTNDAAHPCITNEQYKAIEKKCAEALKLYGIPMQKKAARTHFYWPLKPVSGFKDSSYYYIGNYVDQDTTDTSFKDYNCGRTTYDGHRGTDIVMQPFPFYKMDNNQIHIVAAAAGIIIQKSDGYFDKNCASNNNTANYVILMHPDSSFSLYWHMKRNSLTSKKVGDAVAVGDFLGIVGSSGASSGPHLHFEVWKNINKSSLQDPYAGTCNKLNDSTWWVNQKAYTEPAIIAADMDTAPPILPACPNTETPNEDSCFTPGIKGVVTIFIRNETAGISAIVKILNPDGTTYLTWTHKSIKYYNCTYWYWYKTLPTTPGVYTLEVTYNGKTVDKKFTVDCGAVSGIQSATNESQIQISPNPTNGILNLSGSDLHNGNYNFTIQNVLGQIVLQDHSLIQNNNFQKIISLSNFPNGVYLLTIETGNGKIIRKIVKQD